YKTDIVGPMRPNQLIPAISGSTYQFNASTYSVAENSGEAVITVTRLGGAAGQATVFYSTAEGTALDGLDYSGTSGMLMWGDGETTPATFTVPIFDDAVHQGERYFLVNLSNASGAAVGNPNAATVTIFDNEIPPGITNQPVSI